VAIARNATASFIFKHAELVMSIAQNIGMFYVVDFDDDDDNSNNDEN
jgi:hypothetical protein